MRFTYYVKYTDDDGGINIDSDEIEATNLSEAEKLVYNIYKTPFGKILVLDVEPKRG